MSPEWMWLQWMWLQWMSLQWLSLQWMSLQWMCHCHGRHCNECHWRCGWSTAMYVTKMEVTAMNVTALKVTATNVTAMTVTFIAMNDIAVTVTAITVIAMGVTARTVTAVTATVSTLSFWRKISQGSIVFTASNFLSLRQVSHEGFAPTLSVFEGCLTRKLHFFTRLKLWVDCDKVAATMCSWRCFLVFLSLSLLNSFFKILQKTWYFGLAPTSLVLEKVLLARRTIALRCCRAGISVVFCSSLLANRTGVAAWMLLCVFCCPRSSVVFWCLLQLFCFGNRIGMIARKLRRWVFDDFSRFWHFSFSFEMWFDKVEVQNCTFCGCCAEIWFWSRFRARDELRWSGGELRWGEKSWDQLRRCEKS